ncbi:MAG: flavin reductase family protein [Treponema sp.]|nr:flavin reductase family protein [Treponema sp.]
MIKEIRPEQIPDNAISLISKDWMLVTACTKTVDPEGKITTGRVNTMTASWGGLGELWNKPVATIYIRPQRYTKEIIDETDTFTLSVLPEKYRQALNFCGSHSGRDGDKFKSAKLDVLYNNGTPYIKQARLILFCRKLYAQPFAPDCFVEEKMLKQNYKNDDFHTMYIGEIYKVLIDKR